MFESLSNSGYQVFSKTFSFTLSGSPLFINKQWNTQAKHLLQNNNISPLLYIKNNIPNKSDILYPHNNNWNENKNSSVSLFLVVFIIKYLLVPRESSVQCQNKHIDHVYGPSLRPLSGVEVVCILASLGQGWNIPPRWLVFHNIEKIMSKLGLESPYIRFSHNKWDSTSWEFRQVWNSVNLFEKTCSCFISTNRERNSKELWFGMNFVYIPR